MITRRAAKILNMLRSQEKFPKNNNDDDDDDINNNVSVRCLVIYLQILFQWKISFKVSLFPCY